MTSTEPDHPSLEPGDVVLQKYRVEHALGQGGMGYVVAVRHTELGELSAMKVLLKSALSRPGASERFLREARAAARLKSDHVVRVYDVGKLESGDPYMLMEHLEGKDLATVLEEKGLLPACDVVSFMLEALDAIAEAHALGVVHRDLKPSNLFISARRDRIPLLKVLDFGISKELNAKDQATTHSASVMGSPYYMSPEHMRSAKHVGPATDVWSLGIIMFELLTGRIPFEGETATEVCSKVLETEMPSILEHAPETPEALIEIVRKCLRRAPEDRYTAVELQAALHEVSVAIGEGPRSLLSSGSWLRARVSISGMKSPLVRGTTSDPARQARAGLETIDPPPSGPPASTSTPPVKVSQPPSIQGWSQPPPSHRRRSSLVIVGAVAALCAVGWLASSLRGKKTDRPADAAAQVATAQAATAAISTLAPAASDARPGEQADTSTLAAVTAPSASPAVSASAPPRPSTHAASPAPAHQAVVPAVAAPKSTAADAPALKRPKF